MTESLKTAVTSQQRLSFGEDPSQVENTTLTTESKRYLAVPPQLQIPTNERRQSQWNINKRSAFSRRYSQTMSYGSRKSSQDLLLSSKVRYQNTYKLEPDENTKFYAYKIEPKLYATLEHTLKNCIYDAKKCANMSKELSEDILRETRNCLVNSSRYKLVSHVVIGQLNEHDIRVASRCLWDTTFDNFVCVTYKNSDLFATATLFAVYFE